MALGAILSASEILGRIEGIDDHHSRLRMACLF